MADVQAVQRIDISRYLGRWYEICRLPLKWEDQAASDTKAYYLLSSSGGIRVDNRCFDAEGEQSQAIGEATAVDETNSQLKVRSYLGCLGGCHSPGSTTGS